MKKYNYERKMILATATENNAKTNRRLLATSVINDYDNVSYKYNDKKSKLIIVANKQNVAEIFYSKNYHICTKYNLLAYSKNANYHELWDMKYDIRTDNRNELEKIIDFILTEYTKTVIEYNKKIA